MTVSLLVFATFVGTARATIYYVSPAGSDANDGASATTPWKTVWKVDNTTFQPGDAILFEGGQTFADATLMPLSSGTAAAPITFGSYGSGRATITNGQGAVWIPSGRSYLTFQNLALSTGGTTVRIFADSGTGPSNYVTIADCILSNSGASAIHAAGSGDTGWVIQGNSISNVGDSGLIISGSGFTITRNTISGIGWNNALAWAKHGIYAKGPDLTISYNDFSNIPNGQAISLRYHGARVVGNTIHDTPYALAFFDYDPAPAPQGGDWVYGNRAWNITGYGVYYDGQAAPNGSPPSVDLVLASNTFQLAGASSAVNVAPASNANVTIVNNVFAGTYGSALRAPAPASGKSFVERANSWSGASADVPAGAGDQTADPLLSAPPGLAPNATSPVVDAGVTSAADLVYTYACDGQPLHYCGLAPDLGAAELLSAPVPPAQPAPAPPASPPPPNPTPAPTTPSAPTPAPAPPPATSPPVDTTLAPAPTPLAATAPPPASAPSPSPAPAPSPPPAPAPATDTAPPSTPSGLAVGPVTQQSIAISWSTSTDDVGVAGYDVFLNGGRVGTAATPGYTFGGLACGAIVTLGVAAFDAAGNRSGTASLDAATAPCGDTRPVVTILAPRAGSSVGRSFTVSATAIATGSDPKGIRSVTVLVDGTARCSAHGSALACPVRVVSPGWHAVTVRAADWAGRIASQTIRVRVTSSS